MLTQGDIEFIKQTRAEITANRTHEITVYYPGEGAADPITGEPIGEATIPRTVPSVVTEISSTASTSSERALETGVAIENGDIWFSVDLNFIADIAELITSVKYDAVEYEILAGDKKGIGERNRVEFLGRRIT
ncbi:hypothetical protein [Niallia taxi]|uniref:Uncharacterized protein n=1 Tax=Niallia taxi TaxID=2499688 RepID=A0A437K4H4_9BACI|nr:hypothetical protein [Niallia taxi]RVT57403.1 hypothetical protein EM808_24570 [Niallia taxi]